MPEARLPMLCANYSHTYNLCFACHAAAGTMRGFTVVCMQSSPYFAQGTYVQSMGIHSLRRTLNPWIVSIHALRTVQSMDCVCNPQIIAQFVDP